jgi:hypothetical protein
VARPVILRRTPDGGVVPSGTRADLARVGAHKADLVALADAFADRGPVLVELRPPTPIPLPRPRPGELRGIQDQQRRAFERRFEHQPWRRGNLNRVLMP